MSLANNSQPQSAVLVDADNDNKPDIVLSNYYNGMANPNNNLTILLNKGGTYTPMQMTVGPSLYALAVGDFDKNGKLDAVGVHRLASGMASVTTLINKGAAVNPYFATTGNQSGGGQPLSITSADFDGDGSLDLAVGNNQSASNNVAILRGNGQAANTFTDPADVNKYAVGNANAFVEFVTAYDLDLDGTPDVITANYNSTTPTTGAGSLSLLLNNGSGSISFKVAQTIPVSNAGNPNSVAVGDAKIFYDTSHADKYTSCERHQSGHRIRQGEHAGTSDGGHPLMG